MTAISEPIIATLGDVGAYNCVSSKSSHNWVVICCNDDEPGSLVFRVFRPRGYLTGNLVLSHAKLGRLQGPIYCLQVTTRVRCAGCLVLIGEGAPSESRIFNGIVTDQFCLNIAWKAWEFLRASQGFALMFIKAMF